MAIGVAPNIYIYLNTIFCQEVTTHGLTVKNPFPNVSPHIHVYRIFHRGHPEPSLFPRIGIDNHLEGAFLELHHTEGRGIVKIGGLHNKCILSIIDNTLPCIVDTGALWEDENGQSFWVLYMLPQSLQG